MTEKINDWIAFSERDPDPDRDDWFWCASACEVHPEPWQWHELTSAKRKYTHWRPCEPPTDLPPKPLPELPEGFKWKGPCIVGVCGERYRASGGRVFGRYPGDIAAGVHEWMFDAFRARGLL